MLDCPKSGPGPGRPRSGPDRGQSSYFQIKVAQALYAGKDSRTPTGASKTLTFWILILMVLEASDKMSIVVTPLNLLGRQNKEALDKVGINGVAILLGSKV